jgi:hypothetical protein
MRLGRNSLFIFLICFVGIFSPAAAQNAADALFPPVAGFKLTPGEKVYSPDNVFELIDGAADLFLTYGFEELRTAEYSSPDIEYIRIEVYRHSSPVNAFGMYAQERPAETKFFPIGGQGYLEEGALNFWCGRYYVRMTTNAAGENVQTALQTIARSIARSMIETLHQEKTASPMFALFPEKGKKRNSEMYINQDFLGYKIFTSAYSVQYTDGKLFIVDFSGLDTARAALKKYFDLLQVRSGNAEQTVAAVSDPHQGKLLLRLCGSKLAGAVEFQDARTARRNLEGLVHALQGAQ